MKVEIYKTTWSDNRSAWRREPGADGHIANMHWNATVVVDIDEKVFRRLIRVAAANQGKEAQRGPFRLRLKDYTESELKPNESTT